MQLPISFRNVYCCWLNFVNKNFSMKNQSRLDEISFNTDATMNSDSHNLSCELFEENITSGRSSIESKENKQLSDNSTECQATNSDNPPFFCLGDPSVNKSTNRTDDETSLNTLKPGNSFGAASARVSEGPMENPGPPCSKINDGHAGGRETYLNPEPFVETPSEVKNEVPIENKCADSPLHACLQSVQRPNVKDKQEVDLDSCNSAPVTEDPCMKSDGNSLQENPHAEEVIATSAYSIQLPEDVSSKVEIISPLIVGEDRTNENELTEAKSEDSNDQLKDAEFEKDSQENSDIPHQVDKNSNIHEEQTETKPKVSDLCDYKYDFVNTSTNNIHRNELEMVHYPSEPNFGSAVQSSLMVQSENVVNELQKDSDRDEKNISTTVNNGENKLISSPPENFVPSTTTASDILSDEVPELDFTQDAEVNNFDTCCFEVETADNYSCTTTNETTDNDKQRHDEKNAVDGDVANTNIPSVNDLNEEKIDLSKVTGTVEDAGDKKSTKSKTNNGKKKNNTKGKTVQSQHTESCVTIQTENQKVKSKPPLKPKNKGKKNKFDSKEESTPSKPSDCVPERRILIRGQRWREDVSKLKSEHSNSKVPLPILMKNICKTNSENFEPPIENIDKVNSDVEDEKVKLDVPEQPSSIDTSSKESSRTSDTPSTDETVDFNKLIEKADTSSFFNSGPAIGNIVDKEGDVKCQPLSSTADTSINYEGDSDQNALKQALSTERDCFEGSAKNEKEIISHTKSVASDSCENLNNALDSMTESKGVNESVVAAKSDDGSSLKTSDGETSFTINYSKSPNAQTQSFATSLVEEATDVTSDPEYENFTYAEIQLPVKSERTNADNETKLNNTLQSSCEETIHFTVRKTASGSTVVSSSERTPSLERHLPLPVTVKISEMPEMEQAEQEYLSSTSDSTAKDENVSDFRDEDDTNSPSVDADIVSNCKGANFANASTAEIVHTLENPVDVAGTLDADSNVEIDLPKDTEQPDTSGTLDMKFECQNYITYSAKEDDNYHSRFDSVGDSLGEVMYSDKCGCKSEREYYDIPSRTLTKIDGENPSTYLNPLAKEACLSSSSSCDGHSSGVETCPTSEGKSSPDVVTISSEDTLPKSLSDSVSPAVAEGMPANCLSDGLNISLIRKMNRKKVSSKRMQKRIERHNTVALKAIDIQCSLEDAPSSTISDTVSPAICDTTEKQTNSPSEKYLLPTDKKGRKSRKQKKNKKDTIDVKPINNWDLSDSGDCSLSSGELVRNVAFTPIKYLQIGSRNEIEIIISISAIRTLRALVRFSH